MLLIKIFTLIGFFVEVTFAQILEICRLPWLDECQAEHLKLKTSEYVDTILVRLKVKKMQTSLAPKVQ